MIPASAKWYSINEEELALQSEEYQAIRLQARSIQTMKEFKDQVVE